ncbi:MAG: hypothetical protein M1819_003240 [Sarea resinae]|nr:MAG: hypothetical protein M1819_003240 [Sarea resinae]
MQREQLSALLLKQIAPTSTISSTTSAVASSITSPDSPIAIIDVRDDDHIGGHIASSTHIPSTTFHSPTQLSSLVHKLRSKNMVVFHCALSQQRGPRAALAYLRARDDVLAKEKKEGKGEVHEAETRTASSGGGGGREEEGVSFVGASGKQDVYILEGGFVKWQELYGEDPRLTSAYQKDVWRFGY